jgi:hypothetical protein
MIVLCLKCGRYYDDAVCWTICPHGPLEHGLDEYCPKCDTIISRHGPCVHQKQEMKDGET